MLSITDTDITLTRGDSLQIQLTLTKAHETYVPAAGDVIKFYLSSNYKGNTNYQSYVSKTIDNSTLILELAPEDTASMKYGTYFYQLEITYADGEVDTFLEGLFTLKGECG